MNIEDLKWGDIVEFRFADDKKRTWKGIFNRTNKNGWVGFLLVFGRENNYLQPDQIHDLQLIKRDPDFDYDYIKKVLRNNEIDRLKYKLKQVQEELEEQIKKVSDAESAEWVPQVGDVLNFKNVYHSYFDDDDDVYFDDDDDVDF